MEGVFREIVAGWFSSSLPSFVPRDYDFFLGDSAFAVVGPRRAGKTYFMFQVASQLMGSGWDRRSIIYVNFEDVRLSGLKPADYGSFVKVVHELGVERGGRLVLLLDEVQNIPLWGRWIRTLLDARRYYVVVSGSSSRLGVREVPSELRGRYLSRLLLPFSFREFLKFRGVSTAYSEAPEVSGRVLGALREYMRLGGFPEVLLHPEQAGFLIETYRQTVAYRDVVERHGIRDAASFELFMGLVEECFAKQFSITKTANHFRSLGLKKSKKTIANYLKALEEAFYIIAVKRFGYSAREVQQQPRKVYPIDLAYFRRDELGGKMEALVAIELYRRAERGGFEARYVKTERGEVDFALLRPPRVEELLQVTYASSPDEVDRRETVALVDAATTLRPRRTRVITWDLEETRSVEGVKVGFTPLWKWLLEQPS